MQQFSNQTFVPVTVPQKNSSTVKYRVILKKGFIKKDGTCPLYIEIGTKRLRYNLHLSVKPNQWDSTKQEVKSNHELHIDYNLIIKNYLSKINQVLVTYRLNSLEINAKTVLESLNSPNIRVCFNAFAAEELKKQEGVIMDSTIRIQSSSLVKVKEFQDPLYFNDMDEDWLKRYRKWLLVDKKLAHNTIQGHLKNFKKYLGISERKGIYCKLKAKEVKLQSTKNRITFLTKEELNKLDKLYRSEFLRPSYKIALQRFLFACFTGMRIGEIYKLKAKNFNGGYLSYVGGKPPYPLICFPISESAKRYYQLPDLWHGELSKEKVNKYLKEICALCGIQKKVSMHIGRHTFATQYLLTGGNPMNLQNLLGHTNYRMTEKYVHTTNLMLDQDVHRMDSILNVDRNDNK